MFTITSDFSPTTDQKNASEFLVKNIQSSKKDQVLLGVTGSGKTFTMAQVIEKTQLPTLIISHNKTLASQLYAEMKEFFKNNAVCFFVSYYDFYQPEAYIPSSDTYIEKEAQINEYIDKMRLQATTNLMTRSDVIVVASVSCIYNIGSPVEYGKYVLETTVGAKSDIKTCMKTLVNLQYIRSEFDFKRGTFRVRGDLLDIYPSYSDTGIKFEFENNTVKSLCYFDTLTGKIIEKLERIVVYPAKHYMIDKDHFESVAKNIVHDLKNESDNLKKKGKVFEAERLIKKVTYDLEMIRELGYVNGIENYSRYFDSRNEGDPPYTLLDYFQKRFGKKWLTILDESHMTVPQIRGMFNGDYSRKKTLIDYGFRLKCAFDNRPLRFDEFYTRIHNVIYASATPSLWELERSSGHIVEQLVRPTGVIEPEIVVKNTDKEIFDLIDEIKMRIKKNERVLVTTITKRIAEDLRTYLGELSIKCAYLHSDVKTLKRTDILNKLRKKEYDVIIGVNLLREGLDLPEVSLVAILDGDKQGFLRSKTSLIQTMGRASRNIHGKVIIYAKNKTQAITDAVGEVNRRRKYQQNYNTKHNIKPITIKKNIIEQFGTYEEQNTESPNGVELQNEIESINTDSMTYLDKTKYIKRLERQMRGYVDNLQFENAIIIRDTITKIETK